MGQIQDVYIVDEDGNNIGSVSDPINVTGVIGITNNPGMVPVLMTDFGLAVSLGLVPGYSKVNKFGESVDCDSGDPTDIWDGADGATSTAIWVPPKAARIHTIVSGSDTDSDSGGTNPQAAGARTLRVDYLADWDTGEASETVILDGTQGVAMNNACVMINRMEVMTWGANGKNAGVLTATAATDATITSAISAGNNQTQQMIYGVPSTKKLRIARLLAEIVKSTGATQRADAEFLAMRDPATNVVSNTAWTNKENFLIVEANNPWMHPYGPIYKSCNGPCIVKIQVTSNSNGSKAIGAMDAYLVDN